MHHAQVNTTKRFNLYCSARALDGRRCSLYETHPDKHLPKNGLEKDRWDDGE